MKIYIYCEKVTHLSIFIIPQFDPFKSTLIKLYTIIEGWFFILIFSKILQVCVMLNLLSLVLYLKYLNFELHVVTLLLITTNKCLELAQNDNHNWRESTWCTNSVTLSGERAMSYVYKSALQMEVCLSV